MARSQRAIIGPIRPGPDLKQEAPNKGPSNLRSRALELARPRVLHVLGMKIIDVLSFRAQKAALLRKQLQR